MMMVLFDKIIPFGLTLQMIISYKNTTPKTEDDHHPDSHVICVSRLQTQREQQLEITMYNMEITDVMRRVMC